MSAVSRRAPSASVPPPILVPGRNCWRVERSHRLAFLRDGDAYFRAAAEAMARARKSILLLSWDIDSRLEINRDGIDGLPAELGPFLDALAARRPGLRIHILSWDFAAVFALEREALPTVKLDWSTHPNVHLQLDDRHPPTASHHQKVLVVDDSVAFAGGLDLTRRRWDTPSHDPEDPRRRDHSAPDGYAPFHDVQAVVDGPCARALGDLARERWRLATGERLSRPRAVRDAWPPGLVAALIDARVGISRTLPALPDQDEVREAERLFLDEIAACRRTLYVENQYFTSHVVTGALEAALRRPDGPEIVIVLPRTSSGWLEEATMGQLRSSAILRLRAADPGGRLRIVYPGGPARGEARLNVHAKVLIADDGHVRVGSANMSNRSMSFDSECDLAADADGPEARAGIRHFRAELLGEHLGLAAGEVERRLGELGGSLVRLVDACASAPRALVPLVAEESAWVDALEPAIELADPSRPPRLGPPRRSRRRGLVLRAALATVAIVGLSLLWISEPVRELLRPEEMARFARAVQGHPAGILLVIATHAVAGLVAMPVSLLILATMLAFGPAWGSGLALAGCLANAAAGYGMGRLMGRGIEGLLRDRFAALTSLLRRHGALSVAAVRLVPVAPYSLINYAAGALRVPFRDYLAGTTLGILPGIILLAALGHGLREAVEHPGAGTIASVAALVAACAAASVLLRRHAARLHGPERP